MILPKFINRLLYGGNNFFCRFMKRHFSTDYLLGSWWYLIGSIIYTLISVMNLFGPSSLDLFGFETIYDNLYNILGSLAYLIASVLFIETSYPEVLQATMQEAEDPQFINRISKLNCFIRYFGTKDILATWGWFAGALFYMLISFDMLLEDVLDWYAWYYFLTSFAYMYASVMWVYSAVSYDYDSSFCYDYLVCCKSKFMKRHLGTDFLVGSWMMLILSTMSLGESIGSFIAGDSHWMYWLSFISNITFVLGALYFVRASYPEYFLESLLIDGNTGTIQNSVEPRHLQDIQIRYQPLERALYSLDCVNE